MELDAGFLHAFLASLFVIVMSELGDKTFFIAAIMAMKNPRLTVFGGAMLANGLMTLMSVLLGLATTVIPRWITYYTSCIIFMIFGIKMLKEAYEMDADEAQEEYDEAQEELKKKDRELEKPGRVQSSLFSPIFLQSFTMTFFAEWGDRSQIATFVLAARDGMAGVVIGGTLGQALCTGLAVLGGRWMAQHISLRTVHVVGGVIFLLLALSPLFVEMDDPE